MKKLAAILLSSLVLYSIYFDLTKGTLPHGLQKTAKETIVAPQTDIPYFEAKVKPGDTLISIVEHHIKKPLPVPINDLIHDFKALNPGKTADKIQIGQAYRFPDYSK